MYKSLLTLLCCATALFGQEYVARDFSHLIGMQGFSEKALQAHFTLYQGYVKNANAILEALKREEPKSPAWSELKRRFGWEYDGMRLHEYYFENLGGNGQWDAASPIARQMERDFGSVGAWREDFVATGAMRGIGWVILTWDPARQRLLNVWINEHDVGHLAGGTPLLVMDVFEHAYLLDYVLDRAKYIDAFFQNLDWGRLSKRYDAVPR